MKMLDLEALTDILMEYPDGEMTNKGFAEWLEEQTAEDIIHCYECQHYDNRFGACRLRDDTDTQFVAWDSYCSYGERKEGEP